MRIKPQVESDVAPDFDGVEPKGKIYGLPTELLRDGSINEFEAEALLQLIALVEEDYVQGVDFQVYRSTIDDLIIKYESQQSLNGNENGLLGMVLALSDASVTWWQENPEAMNSETRAAVACFIGRDVAGAVISAGVSAAGSYVMNDGDIQWKGVAWAAAGRAISGSLGAVGKLGKFLGEMGSKAWESLF